MLRLHRLKGKLTVRPFHLCLFIVATSALIGLSSCSGSQPPGVPAQQLAEAHPSWNGLKITSARPGDKLPDIAMKSMNMHIWEFETMLPDPQRFWSCNIQGKVAGKTIVLSNLATGMPVGAMRNDPNRHLTLAMFPEGDSWFNAPKVRCILAIDSSGAFSTEHDNPLRGAKMMAKDLPTLLPDGSFRLMWGSKQTSVSSADPDIAVTVTFAVKVIKPSRK